MTPTELWAKYGDAVIATGVNLTAAIAILFAGLWLSARIANWVKRLAKKNERIDDTLAAFFASIVRYGMIAFVLIAVLDRFGVQTTQIIAVLGAATLAIGLALQGTLSNVAAGVMLILFRPYRLGDFVEVAGQKGLVRDVNIFTTELATLDNIKVVLPNSQCWGAPIQNYTALPTRRLDLEFGVAYDVDLNKALAVIGETIAKDPRAMAEPAPLVRVSKLGDFAVTILAHTWCKTDDIFHLRLDLTKAVKEALDRHEIAIPFPTQVAYHHEIATLGPMPKAPIAPELPPPSTPQPMLRGGGGDGI